MDFASSLPPLHGEGGAQRRVGNAFAQTSPALTASRSSLPTTGEGERLRKTATDFEANFMSMMLKPMFEGLETDGVFGGGEAEATWRSFLIDSIARETTKAGGIGLADTVMSEMLKMQEMGA